MLLIGKLGFYRAAVLSSNVRGSTMTPVLAQLFSGSSTAQQNPRYPVKSLDAQLKSLNTQSKTSLPNISPDAQ